MHIWWCPNVIELEGNTEISTLQYYQFRWLCTYVCSKEGELTTFFSVVYLSVLAFEWCHAVYKWIFHRRDGWIKLAFILLYREKLESFKFTLQPNVSCVNSCSHGSMQEFYPIEFVFCSGCDRLIEWILTGWDEIQVYFHSVQVYIQKYVHKALVFTIEIHFIRIRWNLLNIRHRVCKADRYVQVIKYVVNSNRKYITELCSLSTSRNQSIQFLHFLHLLKHSWIWYENKGIIESQKMKYLYVDCVRYFSNQYRRRGELKEKFLATVLFRIIEQENS